MSYEKNCYVSDLLNAGVKGHVFYGFADIVTNNDNLLFIDPLLLEINQNGWHKEANAVVKSFFDSFFQSTKMETVIASINYWNMQENRMEPGWDTVVAVTGKGILLQDCLRFLDRLIPSFQVYRLLVNRKT